MGGGQSHEPAAKISIMKACFQYTSPQPSWLMWTTRPASQRLLGLGPACKALLLSANKKKEPCFVYCTLPAYPLESRKRTVRGNINYGKVSDTSPVPDTAILASPHTVSLIRGLQPHQGTHLRLASLKLPCHRRTRPARPSRKVPAKQEFSRIRSSSPLRCLPLPPRTPLRKTPAAPPPGSRPGFRPGPRPYACPGFRQPPSG